MRLPTPKFFKDNRILLLTLLVTILVYSKLLTFGFISWDDPEMVFKNRDVKAFNFLGFFNTHYVGNYIPITMLMHAFTYFLFKDWAGGHHLLSLLFHFLNGYLVYRLTLLVFKNKNLAIIVIIIFLMHPLQIESVAWISEFKTVLSATFFLASILCFTKSLQNLQLKYYLLSVSLFCLASLSKPSVLMLPFVLFLFEWLMVGKVSLNSIVKQIPFLIISSVVAYITILTQTADQFINHAHEFNYFVRTGFAGLAYFNYLLLFLLPINLSVIYTYPTVSAGNLVIGYVTIILIILVCIYFFKTKKTNLLVAFLFFAINVMLMLQFMPFGEALFADRYMYLSIIGLAWLIAFTLEKYKLAITSILVVLLLVNAFFSYGRLPIWRNSLSVYEDILSKYPEQFVALNSAGVECMMLNEHEKSLAYFRKAVQFAPNNYKGYYNMGLLYIKTNQPEQAIESFNRTINLYEYYKAYAARASAYYMLNDLPKAINDANKALLLNNNNPKAHFILGNCYNDLNQLDQAILEYNLAIQLNGEESDYYFKRAIVLGKKQLFSDCLNDLIVCLELNPNNYEAHYWKGVSLVNLNKNPCEDFKIAAQNNFEPAVSAYNKYCRQ